MPLMGIQRCFVAGAGLMGHGIAQVLAASGRTVDLYEPELDRAVAGRERIAANLERAVAKGRLDAAERLSILDRVAATAKIGAVADADLAIEAVFEVEAVKRELLARLDGLAPGRTIFASNTSSISIDRLASAFAPARRPVFLGLHFFSPVPVMPLVEIVRGWATDEATMATIKALAADLGKQVVVSADRPGFIVNRMLMPFLAEAMRTLEEEVASAEDIDTGARLGLNHPMGPLSLADFIGLDVVLGIMRVLHADCDDERFAPPNILQELVATGHLGQKTGRGFFAYPRD
jgi:3-hydroxybutyryl-CoA dehydrogenase